MNEFKIRVHPAIFGEQTRALLLQALPSAVNLRSQFLA
jgi:hypothetical protein